MERILDSRRLYIVVDFFRRKLMKDEVNDSRSQGRITYLYSSDSPKPRMISGWTSIVSRAAWSINFKARTSFGLVKL